MESPKWAGGKGEIFLGALNEGKWGLRDKEMMWWNPIVYLQGTQVHGWDMAAPVYTAHLRWHWDGHQVS